MSYLFNTPLVPDRFKALLKVRLDHVENRFDATGRRIIEQQKQVNEEIETLFNHAFYLKLRDGAMTNYVWSRIPHGSSRTFDHCREFKLVNRYRARGFISQPYFEHDAKELAAFIGEHDVSVTQADAWSWHYPGRTTLFLVVFNHTL